MDTQALCQMIMLLSQQKGFIVDIAEYMNS